MTRNYYAIDNVPYGRAQDSNGRRIGSVYAFASRAWRDAWVAESPTDYQTVRGYREPIAARTSAVRDAVAGRGDLTPVSQCTTCGTVWAWTPESEQEANECAKRYLDRMARDYSAALDTMAEE